MTRYNVESRRDYTEIFDNYIGDYIEANSEEEAIEYAKQWLIENGMEPEEVEELEFRTSIFGQI